MSGYFYIDASDPGHHRYDVHRFMEFSEGLYDGTTSWLLFERLPRLPVAGRYRISVATRPDIYSRDVYGTTDLWQLLLLYNDVVLMETLTPGKLLSYFDLNDLEREYFSLSVRQAGVQA